MESLAAPFPALAVLLALFAGLAIGATMVASRARVRLADATAAARSEAELRAAAPLATLTERAQRLPVLEQELERLRERLDQVQDERSQLAERIEAERTATQDKINLLVEAREALTVQFQQLASAVLEEKSRRFSEQNQLQLGQLLDPLRLRIHEFQAKVEDVYVKDTRERGALAE
jgi:DNA recombination protein RmuC